MTDQTATTGQFRIPTGDELYDMLMQGIEPDLTTKQLPLLSEKYKDETNDKAKIRAERYQKAFAEYDRQLSAYLARLQAKVHEYQTTARKSLETDERTKEGQALSGIEEEIGAA